MTTRMKCHFDRAAILLCGFLACLLVFGGATEPARALEAIKLNGTKERIEITRRGVAVEGRGDELQIDTAPGVDGISRRMSVQATTPGTDPNWIVFALRNTTEKTLERWVTVQRYSIIGSGVVWPDLDSRRLEALSPSVGFLPQRIKDDRADIFKISIAPGQTVTYAAEMASARFSRIYLWKPLAYEFQLLDRRLFNGIMLGITGLLGVFLTAVFAANHKAIFPSAALLTWCVLAYLCVDFGFWHKLLQLQSTDTAVYRAATEAAMATSLSIFLHTFLRLGSWNGFVRMLSSVWLIANLALVFVAVLDPRLASTFARLSFAALGVVGTLLTLFLALRGQDRALSLLPTWMLFLVWLFGATMTLTGKLNGDLVVSGLVAGLVLIVVLVGFTVTQFAFRNVDPHYGTAPSEQQIRSLAVDGAGAAVWEWHARRDEVKVGAVVEASLGLNVGELSSKVRNFVKHLHPADQERFNVLLWSVQEKNGGVIRTDFRMRHADNSYRWFDLEASSVPSADRRSLRCVGLLRDVTDQKRAQSRLMHDAVNDSLTGLPNRELFVDRLRMAIGRTRSEPGLRPTVIFIDLDKFKSMNASFGLVVGDSILLTVARRLSRHLGPQDTLARISGDRFAMLSLSGTDVSGLEQFGERIRRALRSPIKIAGQDIVLSGSIGIAIYDPAIEDANDLLRDAEVAMYRAKRHGADHVEIFRPELRSERDDRSAIEGDLRQALERQQVQIFFQPIIYLPTEELAGFEALARWEHPKHGLLNPHDYIPTTGNSDLAVRLGSYLLTRAVDQAAKWQDQLPRLQNPLFVSVNISSRQLFQQDLIQEIRHIVGRQIVPEGVLRLEVTESVILENPEQSADLLDLLKIAGADLCLDDFGAGYTSLAYLDRLPVDTIKISRDLVQSVSGTTTGSSVVRSIVAMAQELDLKVVAEGVEVPEDVAMLRSIGCQYAQGFYYGEPMGERDVTDLLKIVRKSERKLQRRGFFRSKLAGAGLATDSQAVRKRKRPTEAQSPENGNVAPAAVPAAAMPASSENGPLGRPEPAGITPGSIPEPLKPVPLAPSPPPAMAAPPPAAQQVKTGSGQVPTNGSNGHARPASPPVNVPRADPVPAPAPAPPAAEQVFAPEHRPPPRQVPRPPTNAGSPPTAAAPTTPLPDAVEPPPPQAPPQPAARIDQPPRAEQASRPAPVVEPVALKPAPPPHPSPAPIKNGASPPPQSRVQTPRLTVPAQVPTTPAARPEPALSKSTAPAEPGGKPPVRREGNTLPPDIAESLAKLAGMPPKRADAARSSSDGGEPMKKKAAGE